MGAPDLSHSANTRPDPATHLRNVAALVGYTEQDHAYLGASIDLLAAHVGALVDGVYEHLLANAETRLVFLGTQGELDEDYMAARREHLSEWLLRTLTSESIDELGSYWATVARMHGPSKDRKRMVHPRFVVALTGFAQAAVIDALLSSDHEDREAVKGMCCAWTKLWAIHLELFLANLVPAWQKSE